MVVVFTASFGPGGFRTHNVRTNVPRREAAQENAQPRSIFMQLLPIFILFGFTFLNALPSLFSSPPTPDPHFSFSRSPRYNVERSTSGLGIKYHVNGAEFSGHPIAAELAKNGKQPHPSLQRFESTIERAYTQDLYTKCQRGVDRKERAKSQEVGLFGIGTDWQKVQKIDAEKIESCEELRRMGLLK